MSDDKERVKMLRRVMPLLGIVVALIAGERATASGQPFDYKDPKEISAVSLTLDSKLEPIVGYAKGISGTVNFDPANPKATTGKIAVDVASVQFANEGYTATARGYALRGDKYPQIFFTLRKVLNVTQFSPGVYRALVQADFTCKGITLPLTLPVTASYYPGLAEERTNGKYQGDILVLRTKFSVSRKKLGISEGIPDSMVGDAVQVGVAVVGLHYAPNQKKPESARPEQKQPEPEKPQVTRSQWKMEVEQRDNPIKVDAEFDLNAQEPKAVFITAQGSLLAERVRLTDGKLTFHLPENPQVVAADGEAVFAKESVRGLLVTKNETLKFHARLKRAGEDIIRETAAVSPQGPGFRDLTIETKDAKWTLAERMKFHHVPAVSLARIENYQVVETGVFGVVNVETGEPAEANTLFQAGGMGSPLINLLALRLVASGRLDLNREVNAYLKSAKIPDNAFTRTRKVTVLDLVNGTSGLSQYKFTGYRPGATVPTLAQLIAGEDTDEMQPLQVERAPGTFRGEGVCGALLEQVIVDATGKPFPELMQELVFLPFGMTHSTYETFPHAASASKVALGHYSTGELMLDRYHIYPETGESGLWTTAGDFARMLCQVQLLLAGKPNLILTGEQQGLLKAVNTEKWVLGFVKSNANDFLPAHFLYHGGDSYGYYANHATSQEDGNGMVVMENRIMGWALNNEIIRAVGTKHGLVRKVNAPTLNGKAFEK